MTRAAQVNPDGPTVSLAASTYTNPNPRWHIDALKRRRESARRLPWFCECGHRDPLDRTHADLPLDDRVLDSDTRRAVAINAAERGFALWELAALLGDLSPAESAWFARNRRVAS
jgi:hypothetical protein